MMPDTKTLWLAHAYLRADHALREAHALRELYRQELLEILGPAARLTLPECTITNCHGQLSVDCP